MMKAMLTQEENKRDEVEDGWQHDTEGNNTRLLNKTISNIEKKERKKTNKYIRTLVFIIENHKLVNGQTEQIELVFYY